MPSIEPPQAVTRRGGQGGPVLLPRWGTVELRVLTGAVAGAVLLHQVEIGVARYLLRQKAQHLLRPSDTFGHHQVPDQESAPGEALIIEHEVPHLAMHLPHRQAIGLDIVAHLGEFACERGVPYFMSGT